MTFSKAFAAALLFAGAHADVVEYRGNVAGTITITGVTVAGGVCGIAMSANEHAACVTADEGVQNAVCTAVKAGAGADLADLFACDVAATALTNTIASGKWTQTTSYAADTISVTYAIETRNADIHAAAAAMNTAHAAMTAAIDDSADGSGTLKADLAAALTALDTIAPFTADTGAGSENIIVSASAAVAATVTAKSMNTATAADATQAAAAANDADAVNGWRSHKSVVSGTVAYTGNFDETCDANDEYADADDAECVALKTGLEAKLCKTFADNFATAAYATNGAKEMDCDHALEPGMAVTGHAFPAAARQLAEKDDFLGRQLAGTGDKAVTTSYSITKYHDDATTASDEATAWEKEINDMIAATDVALAQFKTDLKTNLDLIANNAVVVNSGETITVGTPTKSSGATVAEKSAFRAFSLGAVTAFALAMVNLL